MGDDMTEPTRTPTPRTDAVVAKTWPTECGALLYDLARSLEAENAKLRAALDGLLVEVESLDDYSLTRDTEPYKAQACWDYAIDTARTVLTAAAGKGEEK